MDSKYRAIPKNPYVELRLQDEVLTPTKPPTTNVLAFDVENLVDRKTHKDGTFNEIIDDDGGGDDDLDVHEFTLLAAKRNQGSGIYGAVFNLTTSIIGAGIMALPATMKVLGLVLGFVLIVFMGIISEISVEWVVKYAALHKASSFGEIVGCALGKRAKVLSEICIIVGNSGVLIVYLIIMGDVMSGSLHHMGVFDQWLGPGMWDHRKLLIFVVVVIFLAPLCALNKIDSLSLTSAASVALAVVFVVVCFVVALIKLVEGKIEAPRMGPDFSSETAMLDLLVVIPIMTNAYVCHFNIQPIYNELPGRSPQKMNLVSRITTALCIVVYASTAVSGYLLFGKDTESDILTNFDADLGIAFSSALDYIVRVGYILHLVLVFPVVHFSLRKTVDELVFEGAAPLAESKKRSLALTGVLLALIYFGSTMIPNIWTAFKFTGATTAVSLGFIFPPLIALKLSTQGEGLSAVERFMSWMMLVLAVIVSIAGVIGNIYTLKEES